MRKDEFSYFHYLFLTLYKQKDIEIIVSWTYKIISYIMYKIYHECIFLLISISNIKHELLKSNFVLLLIRKLYKFFSVFNKISNNNNSNDNDMSLAIRNRMK